MGLSRNLESVLDAFCWHFRSTYSHQICWRGPKLGFLHMFFISYIPNHFDIFFPCLQIVVWSSCVMPVFPHIQREYLSLLRTCISFTNCIMLRGFLQIFKETTLVWYVKVQSDWTTHGWKKDRLTGFMVRQAAVFFTQWKRRYAQVNTVRQRRNSGSVTIGLQVYDRLLEWEFRLGCHPPLRLKFSGESHKHQGIQDMVKYGHSLTGERSVLWRLALS